MNSSQLPIYIISLARSRQRYEAIRRAWEQAGFNLQLWSGVDGLEAIRFEDGESVDFKREITGRIDCQIATYLSHYRLWRHCWESGLERVLIIEDDATPTAALPNCLDELCALPATYEIIRLHSSMWSLGSLEQAQKYPLLALAQSPYTLHRPFHKTFSAVAYIAHRRGLEKLLRHGMPIRSEVDFYMQRFQQTGVRLYGVFPMLVNTGGVSTIIGVPAESQQYQRTGREPGPLGLQLRRMWGVLARIWCVLRAGRDEFFSGKIDLKRLRWMLRGEFLKASKKAMAILKCRIAERLHALR